MNSGINKMNTIKNKIKFYFIILNVLDFFTTIYGIYILKYSEFNPIVNYLLSNYGIFSFIILKVVGVLYFLSLWKFSENKKFYNPKIQFYPALLIFTIVIISNFCHIIVKYIY